MEKFGGDNGRVEVGRNIRRFNTVGKARECREGEKYVRGKEIILEKIEIK